MSEITTAQYTPGPWRVFGYEVVDAKDQRVASTMTPSRPHPEERANARLIAAAPTLLIAAQLLVDNCWRCNETGEYEYDRDGKCALCYEARVGIAKAEGH